MSASHGHFTPEVHEHADSWHHHAIDVEGIPQAEHGGMVNPIIVAKWFILIVVSVVGTCGVLYLYFSHYTTGIKSKQFETVSWSKDSAEYKATKEREQTTVEWIDHDHLRIPIAAAMDKVKNEYASKKPAETKAK